MREEGKRTEVMILRVITIISSRLHQKATKQTRSQESQLACFWGEESNLHGVPLGTMGSAIARHLFLFHLPNVPDLLVDKIRGKDKIRGNHLRGKTRTNHAAYLNYIDNFTKKQRTKNIISDMKSKLNADTF